MSDKVILSASPFIISKSILKHPLKDPNSRFHVQTKQKNLHLFINKKHSELQSLFGLSSRNHAISYVTTKLAEQAGPLGFVPKAETESSEQDNKDPFSHQAYRQSQEREKEEALERKRKVKKMKIVTRDQKLRAYVYRYVTPNVVENMYKTYREKQKEHQVHRFRDTGSVDLKKLIHEEPMSKEVFEDFFIVQAMRAEGLNASTLMNVPGKKSL